MEDYMIVKKRVLGSAVLAAAIVSAASSTAMAAPKQAEVTVEAEATEDSSRSAAGLALKITEGFQNADEEASIEKNETDVVTSSEMSEEETAWESRLMANVEDSLNVRTEPSEEAELAGKLRKGDMAQIEEQGEEWTKITSGNVSGYVKNEFCVFGQEAYEHAKANCATNATVLEGGLRLREGANEESRIFDVAAQDDVLTVATDVESPEGWVAVHYGDGTAYVSAQYVRTELAVGTGITVAEEQEIIARQQAEEEAKRAQEAAAQAAATSQAAPAVSQNAAVAANFDETTILAATIQLEAGSEPYDGQVAVGAVIMNRVRSGSYPGSISGVIYQPGQFSVSGRVAGLAASGVSASCMQAAQAALSGVDNTGGALSFAPVSSGRGGFVIGNHVFY